MPDLRAKKQRLARAYADGGFTLADYEARMAALDAEIRLSEADVPVEAAEVVALLSDLPGRRGVRCVSTPRHAADEHGGRGDDEEGTDVSAVH